MEEKTDRKMEHIIDMKTINVVEIKVNKVNEIYMIKSSEKSLIVKNKLISADILPILESSSSSSSSRSSSISIFSDKKLLLYNPEIEEKELYTFMRHPEKYSFLDVVNIKQISWSGAETKRQKEDILIEVVGPKLSFLSKELTLYVIQEEQEHLE